MIFEVASWQCVIFRTQVPLKIFSFSHYLCVRCSTCFVFFILERFVIVKNQKGFIGPGDFISCYIVNLGVLSFWNFDILHFKKNLRVRLAFCKYYMMESFFILFVFHVQMFWRIREYQTVKHCTLLTVSSFVFSFLKRFMGQDLIKLFADATTRYFNFFSFERSSLGGDEKFQFALSKHCYKYSRYIWERTSAGLIFLVWHLPAKV